MPAATKTQFGKLLREFRERAGLDQRQLGSLLKVSDLLIQKLERGKRKPPRDLLFYYQLRDVPEFTDHDIMRLWIISFSDTEWEYKPPKEPQAFHTDIFTQGIRKSQRSYPQIDLEEEPQKPHLRFPNVAVGNYGKIPSKTVKSGEHLSGYTPDPQQQGDPSAAQGTNPLERGLESPSRKERRRKPASPEQARKKQGVVYDRERARYAREYLQVTAETLAKLQVAAVKNPNDPLSPAAVRALGEFTEEVVKIRGISASDAAREFNVPTDFLLRWAKKEGIITILSVGIGPGSPTFLDREEARGAADIFHEAKRQGIQPKKLLQAMASA
jgi:transcriptional regulator with XRE-family HTH domain